jgi:hypothetical protein
VFRARLEPGRELQIFPHHLLRIAHGDYASAAPFNST